MLKHFIYLYLAMLMVGKVEAQIKYRGIEFQGFHNSFPTLAFPFVLDAEAVLKQTERETYPRIAQREAEKFLGINYAEILENTSPIPEKVPHLVGSFVVHEQWCIIIYYWFPYPPKRERNDNFELVVFDRQGGKHAHEIIAGAWADDTRFATLRYVGKDIVIEISNTQNNQTQTYLRTITADGQIR